MAPAGGGCPRPDLAGKPLAGRKLRVRMVGHDTLSARKRVVGGFMPGNTRKPVGMKARCVKASATARAVLTAR